MIDLQRFTARETTGNHSTVAVFTPVFPPIFPTLPALHSPSSNGDSSTYPDGTDPLLGGHAGAAGGRPGAAT
jgi:hypothetical protein